MSRRPAFLRRSIEAENRRRQQSREADKAAGGAFRWAAIGVAIVMVLLIAAGFGGNRTVMSGVAALDFLNREALFGFSWIDIIAVLLVTAASALYLYRDWRRTRR